MKLKAEIFLVANGVGKYRTKYASLVFSGGESVSIPFKKAADLIGKPARGSNYHSGCVTVVLLKKEEEDV